MIKEIFKKFSKCFYVIGKICIGLGSILWVASTVTAFAFPDVMNSMNNIYTAVSSSSAVMIVLGAVIVSNSSPRR